MTSIHVERKSRWKSDELSGRVMQTINIRTYNLLYRDVMQKLMELSKTSKIDKSLGGCHGRRNVFVRHCAELFLTRINDRRIHKHDGYAATDPSARELHRVTEAQERKPLYFRFSIHLIIRRDAH